MHVTPDTPPFFNPSVALLLDKTQMKIEIIFRFSIFAIAVGLVGNTPSWSSEYAVGLVMGNTFLISEQPDTQRNNRHVHSLVGYLPTGTRVYFKEQQRTINNLTEAGPEIYYKVFSSIGIDGLIREDRFIRVEGERPIAKVIGTIWLHHPDPDKGDYKKLLKIGRYDNAYLEITRSNDTHYFATLIRRENIASLPKEEPVRLWKEHVEQGDVIIVEPQLFDEENLPAPRSSDIKKLDNDIISLFVDKMAAKLSNIDKDEVRSFISQIGSYQCLISADANVDLGLKVLGSGFSFEFDMSLLDQDQMVRLTKRTLISKRKQPVEYILMHNIKCNDGNPERLHRFTLQEGVVEFEKRVSVRLQDLAKSDSQWVTSLQGDKLPYKMVRIANEQDYIKVLHQLNKLVETGYTFISEMSLDEQETLLNLILREISHFEHRDDLVS